MIGTRSGVRSKRLVWLENWLAAKSRVLRRAVEDVENYAGGLSNVELRCAEEGWKCWVEAGQVVILR